MNKCLYYSLISILLLLTTTQKAIADHCAGGELIYEWISDSTFRFTFKFYRDCKGISEPPSVTMCCVNPCDGTLFYSILPKITTLPDGRPNGQQVATGCPGYQNTCDDKSASLPGYREWWYVDEITLPGSCTNWNFSISISARNLSSNITGGNLVIIATMNNVDAPHNSSPFFTVKPVPYVCINTPYTFNNGVVDKNQDSLSFESQIPIRGISCSQNQNIIRASYRAKVPVLGLPNNPFQTNNSFTLNGNNGNLSFTPTELGAQTTSFIIKEYRNGKLIGTVMRDVQVQVLNCTTPTINMNIDTPTVVNGTLTNNGIEVCYNNKLDFCFDVKANNSTTILVPNDNHDISIPNATITYTNKFKDSIRGCVSWTPSILDTGLKVLTITTKDSTCRAPGVAVTQTFTVPIKVNSFAPPPVIVSPIDLCKDEVATPLTASGINLLWYPSSTGGIGSPTAPTPTTSILGQFAYYVSHVPNGCTSARVPIIVNINQGPNINLINAKDTICQHEDLLLYNNAPNSNPYLRSWDVDTGRILQGGATDSIIADWSTPGLKTVTLTIASSVCSVQNSVPIFVKPTPVSFFEMKHNACIGEEIEIRPYKQDNAFYYWTIEGQNIYDTTFVPLYKFKWNEPGEKRITLRVTDNNGCIGPLYDTVVDIHVYPDATISGPDFNDICYGKEFELSVQEGLRYKYEWTPPLQFVTYNKNKATARAEQTGFLHVKVSNFWDCASVDSFYIDASPCCDVIMPDAFSPDGNGLNDYYRPLKANNHNIISFTIKNRWGQTIYETRDFSRGWDGRFKGEPQDLGTYYYYLKYLCNGGIEEHSKKGNFTLIR